MNTDETRNQTKNRCSIRVSSVSQIKSPTRITYSPRGSRAEQGVDGFLQTPPRSAAMGQHCPAWFRLGALLQIQFADPVLRGVADGTPRRGVSPTILATRLAFLAKGSARFEAALRFAESFPRSWSET